MKKKFLLILILTPCLLAGMVEPFSQIRQGAECNQRTFQDLTDGVVVNADGTLSVYTANWSSIALGLWLDSLSPEEGSCISEFYGKGINGSQLKKLARLCPKLVRIDLMKCQLITNEVITYVVRHCPSLTHVGFSSCPNFTDAGALAIATYCPNLRWLDVRGSAITENGVRDIVQACRHLHWVDLSYTAATVSILCELKDASYDVADRAINDAD